MECPEGIVRMRLLYFLIFSSHFYFLSLFSIYCNIHLQPMAILTFQRFDILLVQKQIDWLDHY